MKEITTKFYTYIKTITKEEDTICGVLCFCFGAISVGVQGLFLLLHSVITPGDAQNYMGCWASNSGQLCASQETHPVLFPVLGNTI